jgi:membrane AbrB-like protein
LPIGPSGRQAAKRLHFPAAASLGLITPLGVAASLRPVDVALPVCLRPAL